jgi:hypothetical protein
VRANPYHFPAYEGKIMSSFTLDLSKLYWFRTVLYQVLRFNGKLSYEIFSNKGITADRSREIDPKS